MVHWSVAGGGPKGIPHSTNVRKGRLRWVPCPGSNSENTPSIAPPMLTVRVPDCEP